MMQKKPAPENPAQSSSPAATSQSSASGGKRSGAYYQDDGPGDKQPPNLDKIPDAVPKPEPLRAASNRPYSVFGKQYTPQATWQPFKQRGIASWYGRKFHGSKTSSGEIYDMYAMTAAHPVLPIPSYARVTNVSNQRSVIVRINDRGPFHSDRIMDLSYTAAYQLGYVQNGSALVEVESIDAANFAPPVLAAETSARPQSSAIGADISIGRPIAPAPAVEAKALTATPQPPPQGTDPPPQIPIAAGAGGVYLQLGAFSQRDNAESFRARVYRQLSWLNDAIQIVAADSLFRLHLGPYRDRAEAEAVAAKIHESLELKPALIFK